LAIIGAARNEAMTGDAGDPIPGRLKKTPDEPIRRRNAMRFFRRLFSDPHPVA
jgi:hypothetical protein